MASYIVGLLCINEQVEAGRPGDLQARRRWQTGHLVDVAGLVASGSCVARLRLAPRRLCMHDLPRLTPRWSCALADALHLRRAQKRLPQRLVGQRASHPFDDIERLTVGPARCGRLGLCLAQLAQRGKRLPELGRVADLPSNCQGRLQLALGLGLVAGNLGVDLGEPEAFLIGARAHNDHTLVGCEQGEQTQHVLLLVGLPIHLQHGQHRSLGLRIGFHRSFLSVCAPMAHLGRQVMRAHWHLGAGRSIPTCPPPQAGAQTSAERV
jgi:hypothetical protein